MDYKFQSKTKVALALNEENESNEEFETRWSSYALLKDFCLYQRILVGQAADAEEFVLFGERVEGAQGKRQVAQKRVLHPHQNSKSSKKDKQIKEVLILPTKDI